MNVSTKILTVDLEDWFHILDNEETADPFAWYKFDSRVEKSTKKLLALFDKHRVKATFFVLGWIAQEYPELVREIQESGHEIACHSHVHQLVYTQTVAEFEKDLIQATEAIENACGVRPTAYRAPGFSITNSEQWAFRVLSEQGYLVDCSIFPTGRAHGGIPNFPSHGPCILENTNGNTLISMPINVKKIFNSKIVYSGGGYFRIFPFWTLSRFFRGSPYVMTYFHPRDFDPDQPMVPGLSVARKFKSYVGLSRSYIKLERLLSELEFVTLFEAVELYTKENNHLKKIKLDN